MPNQDAVSRIDPTTNTVEQTIAVGNGPTGIAVGGGFVWVANSLDGTVWQIDPQTNGGQVVDKIAVGNGPTGVAYGLGGVWVANSVDRTVVRIDPLTGQAGQADPGRRRRGRDRRRRRRGLGDEQVGRSSLPDRSRGPGA